MRPDSATAGLTWSEANEQTVESGLVGPGFIEIYGNSLAFHYENSSQKPQNQYAASCKQPFVSAPLVAPVTALPVRYSFTFSPHQDARTFHAVGLAAPGEVNNGTYSSPKDGLYVLLLRSSSGYNNSAIQIEKAQNGVRTTLGTLQIPGFQFAAGGTYTVNVTIGADHSVTAAVTNGASTATVTSAATSFTATLTRFFISDYEGMISSSSTGPGAFRLRFDNVLVKTVQTVYGLKSQATGVSGPPTHLFRFNDDATGFQSLGSVRLAGNEIDADAMAMSPSGELRAFQITATGSTYIAIDPATASATAIGTELAGRAIRGAVIDGANQLYALDSNSNELLRIDATNGSVTGALPLTVGGSPFDLTDSTDIAIRNDGTFFLTSSSGATATVYTVNPASGAVQLQFSRTTQSFAGAAFSGGAPDTLFTYEVNSSDDIFRYATTAGFAESTAFSNIISEFNSGRGDLAARTTYAPSLHQFNLSSFTAYINTPTSTASGTMLLRNVLPPGSSSYVTGVGTTVMPSYRAGDALQFAVLARSTTDVSSILNAGVQTGNGDENTLSSRGEMIAAPGGFKWILSNVRTVDAIKPRVYFWIPGAAGQEVEVRQMVLGDPISIAHHIGQPIADAGADQSVNELEDVMLDGTRSSDHNGDALTYSWVQILGSPAVTLSGENTAKPTFTAPQLDLRGAEGTTLTFQLTVSDGTSSSTSNVNVRVSNVNHAPLADAGIDETVPELTTVTLHGENSADTDGDKLSYSWVQTSGIPVALANATTATPSFTAPDVTAAGAILTFRLAVNDGYGGTATDAVSVTVSYVNRAPVADAGADQTTTEGDAVSLAGSASDADGNTLAFAWSQVSGPAVSLSDASSLTPTLIAPPVTRSGADIVLRLTVTDQYGAATADETTIHIANINREPVAQAPANASIDEGTAVTLAGSGSDPDAEEEPELTYVWQQTDGPAVSLTGSGANAGFTAPIVTGSGDPAAKETLRFRLTVTDPNGATAFDDVEVVVTNVPRTPTADAGSAMTVHESDLVSLAGSGSDPDNDPITYSWVQVPTGGPAVVLSGANTASPSFQAPFVSTAGATLKFELIVRDEFGGSSSDTVTVTVANINDPPVINGAQPSAPVLWLPDHRMMPVSVVGVTDANNNATVTITRITQDEPTNGTGDGDTATDAIINPDGTALLRAERSGRGDGRVYTIHFTAADFEGSSAGTVKVGVPKNKKGDTAIDSGGAYNSAQ